MGAQVAIFLTNDIFEERNRHADIQYFLKCVQEFYIESALQIKRRFPLGDPVMKMLQVLDPNTSMTSFPSLAPLVSRFSFIIPESDIEILDGEWRRLSMVELPFDKTDMGPEEYWSKLDNVTDGLGNSQFPTICDFMKILLCIPCSNVDVERIFSDLNNIKTKLRNKLHSSTVSSLLQCKHALKNTSGGSCVGFKPPVEIHQKTKSCFLYGSNDAEDSDTY